MSNTKSVRVIAVRQIAIEVAAIDGHDTDQCHRLADRAEGMLLEGGYVSPLDVLNAIAAMSASLAKAAAHLRARQDAVDEHHGNSMQAHIHPFFRINARDQPLQVLTRELINEDRRSLSGAQS